MRRGVVFLEREGVVDVVVVVPVVPDHSRERLQWLRRRLLRDLASFFVEQSFRIVITADPAHRSIRIRGTLRTGSGRFAREKRGST